MAKGEEESGPSAGATSFLRGVTCGGRRACSPFGLGCEGCAGALGVPRAEGPERAGEERGVALELRGREAGLWRPPPALGRLLAAGLGSVVLCSEALLTDFRGPSVAGRGRALGAGRGSPTSVPAARDRRAMAGEGAAGCGAGGAEPVPPLGRGRESRGRALDPDPGARPAEARRGGWGRRARWREGWLLHGPREACFPSCA